MENQEIKFMELSNLEREQINGGGDIARDLGYALHWAWDHWVHFAADILPNTRMP